MSLNFVCNRILNVNLKALHILYANFTGPGCSHCQDRARLRARSGLSQEQFADFAGLSRVYIAQLETGERGASLNALILIARSVRMTGAELVALIEEEIKNLPH